MERKHVGWWWGAGAVLLGLLHSLRYRPHFSDDAFIALRYADRWVAGKGLTWTDGEVVEGYSDLLWVLLLGGLQAVGLDGVFAARLLGGLGLALAIGTVARRGPVGGLLLAVSGGLAAWAMGGLEHTFLAGLAVFTFEGLRRGRTWDALAVPLTLLRVDAIVLVFGMALALKRPRLAVYGVLATLGQLAFRWSTYGDWLSNSTRAKVAFTLGRVVQGAEWVAEALLHNGVLVVAGLLAVRASKDARAPLVVFAIGCLYVAFVGGDTFYGYRQLVPYLPFLALAAASLDLRRGVFATFLYAVSHLFLTPVTTLAKPGWALAAVDAGERLREAFAEQDPLLATDAAGVLPRTTGFRAVDLLGLNDRWLARHPPEDFGGSARIGHDLGNGAYAASRRPDLVAFCHALGSHTPCFRSGEEWAADEDWSAYVPLFLETDAGLGRYFVRRDGALGTLDSSWRVPAVLLTREDRPLRVEEGRAFVVFESGDVVSLDVPPRMRLQRRTGLTVVDRRVVAVERVELEVLEWKPQPLK